MSTDKTPTISTIDIEAVAPAEEAGAETLRGLWDEAFELEKKLYSERGSDEDRPAPDAPAEEQYAWEREGMALARRESMCNEAMVQIAGAINALKSLAKCMKRLDESAAYYGDDDNWPARVRATVTAEVTNHYQPTTD